MDLLASEIARLRGAATGGGGSTVGAVVGTVGGSAAAASAAPAAAPAATTTDAAPIPAAAAAAGAPKKYWRRGELAAAAAGGSAPLAAPVDAAAPCLPPPTGGATSTPDPAAAPSAATAPVAAAATGPSLAATLAALPRGEVVRRLRKYGQVVTYFGETDAGRAGRLAAWVSNNLLEKADLGIEGAFEWHTGGGSSGGGGGGSGGGGHTEAGRSGIAPLPAAAVPTTAAAAPLSTTAAAAGAPTSSAPDDNSEEEGVGGKRRRRTTAADAASYRDAPDRTRYVYRYFKGLLNEWEDALAARGEAERASAGGREESALFRSSAASLRPFFRMCKRAALPPDVLSLAAEIVRHCEDREYSRAGDAYLRLAIGNAAWPIGVSAVGLHERAAREKVAEGQQAHVMHDEESRKYITVIKRLMTWAQKRYPADPSKSTFS